MVYSAWWREFREVKIATKKFVRAKTRQWAGECDEGRYNPALLSTRIFCSIYRLNLPCHYGQMHTGPIYVVHVYKGTITWEDDLGTQGTDE
jgi:hypothetical protein